MTVLFWIGVAWVAYVYAGYLLLLALIALFAKIRPVMREDYYPSVSVLISARNEEKDIAWKLAETLRWDYPADRLEVLVASDASDDRTDEIVKSIPDPRLRFVRISQRGGKNRALNRLAELARGEVLFFTDANAHLAPDCLRKLVRHFADDRVGCVTGGSRSLSPKESAAVGGGSGLYLGYEGLLAWLESRIGSVLVCDGAVFAIRRSLFRPLDPELANDLELPMRIAHAGYWVRYEPSALALERDTSSAWEEFARRRRICAQGMLAMWKLRHTLRGLRGWQFVSHKFLRWLTLVPLLLILVSSIARADEPFYAALLIPQILLCLAALTVLILLLRGRTVSRFLSVPFYVLLSSVGALTGVIEACLGRRFDVWEIPKLARGSVDETPSGRLSGDRSMTMEKR